MWSNQIVTETFIQIQVQIVKSWQEEPALSFVGKPPDTGPYNKREVELKHVELNPAVK